MPAPTTSPRSSSASRARSRWFELLHGSVVDALVRRSGNIGVQVLAAEAAESEPGSRLATAPRPPFSVEPYVVATALTTLATAIGYFFDQQIDLPNVSMIFIPVVLFAAIRHGLLPSLWATALSTLAYNFFFTHPLFTFAIHDPSNVVAVLFLLLVAVIASQLAAQSRAQAQAARRQAASTAALYGFSRKIAGIGNMDDLLWAIAHQIALMLKAHVVMLLPEMQSGGGDLAVRVGYPPEDELDEADLAAAKWSWSRGQVAGRSSDTLPGAKRLFLPLRTERGLVGVMGLDRPQGSEQGALLSPDERRLLDALADQAAVAIERVTLAAGIDEARVTGETERMRSALLTSISHDLKTPLASIIGSITSLRKFWPTFEAQTRDELLGTVQDEAERLTRFVGNVLDMTRLEAKSVTPQLFPADVAEMLGIVAGDVRRALPVLRLSVETQAGLPAAADGRAPVPAGDVQPARQRREIRAGRQHGADRRARRPPRASRSRCWTRGRGFRPATSSASSTSSSASRSATGGAPAPGSASRSARASSRRWAAASWRRTAPMVPAGRSGALFRVTLKAAPQEPVPDEP